MEDVTKTKLVVSTTDFATFKKNFPDIAWKMAGRNGTIDSLKTGPFSEAYFVRKQYVHRPTFPSPAFAAQAQGLRAHVGLLGTAESIEGCVERVDGDLVEVSVLVTPMSAERAATTPPVPEELLFEKERIYSKKTLIGRCSRDDLALMLPTLNSFLGDEYRSHSVLNRTRCDLTNAPMWRDPVTKRGIAEPLGRLCEFSEAAAGILDQHKHAFVSATVSPDSDDHVVVELNVPIEEPRQFVVKNHGTYLEVDIAPQD